MEMCVLCSSTIGENEEARLIPKAKVHHWCLENDPRTAEEISALLTCCPSRAILQGMGGHLLERRSTIPKDQMWFVMKREGESPNIMRYRVFEQGDVVLATMPTLVIPPKKEEGHEQEQ